MPILLLHLNIKIRNIFNELGIHCLIFTLIIKEQSFDVLETAGLLDNFPVTRGLHLFLPSALEQTSIVTQSLLSFPIWHCSSFNAEDLSGNRFKK